jgi:hypothetical protein
MCQRCPANRDQVGDLQTAAASSRRRQLGHSGRVTDQVWRDKVGEIAHRRQRRIDRLALQGQPRARLAGERLLPRRSPGIERQDLRSLIRKQPADNGIERAARPLADDPRGELPAAQHSLKRGVSSHLHDPHRQWDLIALRTARLALAIPALGDMGEQRPNGSGQAEPVGQHLRHLAQGGDLALEQQRQLRNPERKLPRTHQRRVTRWSQRPHEPRHHLGPRPEPGRKCVGRQRVLIAEDLGGDVGICGAADVEQQARVVRLRRRLRIDAQSFAEPHRDQRAVQPVLEGNTDAEVSRQRQRRDQFRGADLCPVQRHRVWHHARLLS